jgi:hypothetical protein
MPREKTTKRAGIMIRALTVKDILEEQLARKLA